MANSLSLNVKKISFRYIQTLPKAYILQREHQYLWLQRNLSSFLRKERICNIAWCPYWFKVILVASYHIHFYQNQQIIRHPCNTKAFCPFFHFIKHISFSYTTLLVLWYSRLGSSCSYKFGKKFLILQKRALRLIHFKPFRFHAVPLFKLSYVLPVNLPYFKTIGLVMHDVFKNVRI